MTEQRSPVTVPDRSARPSRRDVVRGGVLLAGGMGASGLGGPSGAAHAAPDGPPSDGIVISQGTNLKLSYDEASSRLAVDTTNVLWLLPQEGGRARRLTEDEEDATCPVFLPGGDRLVFQSFRHGAYDICSVDTDTGEVDRHTSGPQHDVEPAVCPRGGGSPTSPTAAAPAPCGSWTSGPVKPSPW
ncbi:TolB family protein [Nocardiopsis kunsanensis]|uniref:TolB family protein n=1 Tax=Nocardiopsis kunsanensis TaxID=141693 RepID=UPI00068641B1|nr:PD40 domain-containing protein [Nocardiopsis kunsanensis]